MRLARPSDQVGLREMIHRRTALALNKLENDVEMISQVWIGKRTQCSVGPDKSVFLTTNPSDRPSPTKEHQNDSIEFY